MRIALVVASFAIVGCGAAKVSPDEMSAEAHKREAQREQEAASRERAKYNPHARAYRPVGSRVDELAGHQEPYNPTEQHLDAARRASEHAREHAQAAVALEAFEAEECRGIEKSVRTTCPVLEGVVRTEEISNGMRFYLKPGSDGKAVVARMRCHFAFARTHHFEGIPACPLYVPGIEIRLGTDQASVEILSKDPSLRAEIRTRSRG